MARRPLIAGNWKMHKTIPEAVALVEALLPRLKSLASMDLVVCPPFVALEAVSRRLRGTSIEVGAQNMHWEPQGAYTGEISAPMLVDLCKYVILGHSERRQYFAESDEIVRRKLEAALAHGLMPILCVGEALEQRERGETIGHVEQQLRAALKDLTAEQVHKIVIAYEPIWAIGTGRAATPEDAGAVVEEAIRPLLHKLFGEDTAESVRVLYGGSVKPENAGAFFALEDIDGALVGGASLQAESFIGIAQAAAA